MTLIDIPISVESHTVADQPSRALLRRAVRAVRAFLAGEHALSEELRSRMLGWRYSGFSVHNQVRIGAERAVFPRLDAAGSPSALLHTPSLARRRNPTPALHLGCHRVGCAEQCRYKIMSSLEGTRENRHIFNVFVNHLIPELAHGKPLVGGCYPHQKPVGRHAIKPWIAGDFPTAFTAWRCEVARGAQKFRLVGGIHGLFPLCRAGFAVELRYL